MPAGRAEVATPSAWNLLVTAQEGWQREVRRALRPLVVLTASGYRNVLVGRVDEPEALLAAVGARVAEDARLRSWLGRVLPIEHTFALDPLRFGEQLAIETGPWIDRIAGLRFHVRVERRGHKGVIDSARTERELGAHLVAALEARGTRPVVDFTDPDVVLAVEVVGNTAGIGTVTRALRDRFPFVRID